LSSLPIDSQLDPRAAGEEIGYTFLACVLVGLSRAPDLVPNCTNNRQYRKSLTELIHVEQIGAVVAPDGALGGEAVLACFEREVPIIAVVNPSVLKVTLDALLLDEGLKEEKVLRASNYVEAAGFLTLLREGITLESLRRPLLGINNM